MAKKIKKITIVEVIWKIMDEESSGEYENIDTINLETFKVIHCQICFYLIFLEIYQH